MGNIQTDKQFSTSVKSLEGVINQDDNMASLEGKKVVWVEDDQFLSDMIMRKFATTKGIFFHSSEGEDALKIISKEMPDIVMLDIILASQGRAAIFCATMRCSR